MLIKVLVLQMVALNTINKVALNTVNIVALNIVNKVALNIVNIVALNTPTNNSHNRKVFNRILVFPQRCLISDCGQVKI